MKKILLFIYYLIIQHLPMQPFPGYLYSYKIRRFFVSLIIKDCGQNVIVKSKCYFGDGSRLSVGNNSQLGQNSRLNGTVKIGSDVLMGPEVVMMATSHKFDLSDITINMQGEADERMIEIGNDVWIGTRAIILPGIKIGDHSIVGAGAVVTKSFPSNSIIGGNPAKLIRFRNE